MPTVTLGSGNGETRDILTHRQPSFPSLEIFLDESKLEMGLER